MVSSYSHFYTSSDGLRLHIRVHGELTGSRVPVVCLPGLTRNARDFEALAAHLAAPGPSSRPVLAFDYRGRGLSEYDSDWHDYNLAVEARDVLAGLISLQIAHAAFIGTSRGGLIVHLLAATKLEMFEAVVLNDVGPELGLEGLAQIRAYLTGRTQPQSWTEAVAAQKAIHGPAFPALTEDDWKRLTHALYRAANGRPLLDFDPALLNTLTALDLTKPLPDLWQQFNQLRSVPLLVIRGEHSRLLEESTVARMQRSHPGLQSVTASGQGHAPLLEVGSLPQEIVAFLNRASS